MLLIDKYPFQTANGVKTNPNLITYWRCKYYRTKTLCPVTCKTQHERLLGTIKNLPHKYNPMTDEDLIMSMAYSSN